VRYVCSMHSEVGATSAGDCPICGMALEKVGARDRQTAAAAAGPPEVPVSATDLLSAPRPGVPPPRYSTDLVRRHVLDRELHAPAWVEATGVAALLYNDELAALQSNELALFFPAAAPNLAVQVRAAAGPATPWDRSTSVVHFRLASRCGTQALRQSAAGWVKLARKPREILVVPAAAVLQGTEGPYLFALSADHRTFTRRAIEIGKVTSGFTAVVAGVSPGELVISINAFFVDAERRLRAERRATSAGAP
jgi:Heavy metal binding domain